MDLRALTTWVVPLPPGDQLFGVERQRSAVLTMILRMVLVFGVLAAVPSIALAAAGGLYGIVLFDLLAVAVIAAISLLPHLPHIVRSVALLALCYFVGLFFLVEVGPVAHIYLFAVPLLAALILGMRAALMALAVNALTLILFGLLVDLEDWIEDAGINDVGGWSALIVNFMFISSVVAISCALLLQRLDRSLLANRRLVLAIESSRDGVMVGDVDGRVTYANEAATEMLSDLGADPSELSVFDLPTADPSDDIASTVRGRGQWQGTVVGSMLELEVVVGSIHDRGEVSVVSVLRDVTAERSMAEELRRAERLQALGTLVGGTAHDFNNILTSILGLTEALRDDPESSERAATVENILIAAERARDVVSRLMLFGQRSQRERNDLRLRAVVDEVVPLLRASVPSHITIAVEAHADPVVDAHPTDIHHILANLVANAAHAMRDHRSGRITIVVTTTLSSVHPAASPVGNKLAVLAVADTGDGIDPAVRSRIFDPYFTTKEAGEGTGLGLASVHGAVSSLSGTVTVDSEVGIGTTVRILLPQVAETGEQPSEPTQVAATGEQPSDPITEAESKPAPGSGSEIIRVLFVDDEPMIRQLAQQTLDSAGFSVTAVGAAEDALELCSAAIEPFDVVLTDLTMPGMNGIELVRAIREFDTAVAAVVASGNVDAVSPEQRAELGIFACVQKPYTRDELEATVRSGAESAAQRRSR